MKQNKGISQIVVMVIMLILAIALPITTKLVQKSQENRSKAHVNEMMTDGGSVSILKCLDSKNNWRESGVSWCEVDSKGDYVAFYCRNNNGVGEKTPITTTASSNLCDADGWIGDDSKCINKKGVCVNTNDPFGDPCTLPATKIAGKIETGLCKSPEHYMGYRCCVPNSVPTDTTSCSSISNSVCVNSSDCASGGSFAVPASGNFSDCNVATGGKTCCIKNLGDIYTNTSQCKAVGGYCADFPVSLKDGDSCSAHISYTESFDNGTIKYGLCGSTSTIHCCVPKTTTNLPGLNDSCGNGGKCINTGTGTDWPTGTICSVNGGTNNGKIEVGLCSGGKNIRCCVPDTTPSTKWKKGSCNTTTGKYVCTSGTDSTFTISTKTACEDAAGCDVAAPTTKWKKGSCNTTTGKYVCTSGTDSTFTISTKTACEDAAGCDVAAPTIKWKVTTGSCNTTTGNYTCTSGTDASYTFASQADCVASAGCDIYVCTAGDKQCSGTKLQTCTNNAWVDTTDCGTLGCNVITKTCNECVSGQQKCSTNNNYFTCVNGKWSTSTTNCIDNEVCTNTNVANDVCIEPDYIAPKLTMHVAMLGIGGKNIQPKCLGETLTLRVNVAKFNAAEGDRGITRQVTATKVNDKFSTVKTAGDGYQVYEIKDFALDTTYLPSDRIFVNVTSPNNSALKLLATLYGKNNQTAGYAAQNGSQLLISALSNPLNFYNYPILNGDIGSDNSNTLGDGVLNGSDFGHIKNQWGKSVASGQAPLRADLNGDCVVDSLDFQIYKKSSEEQYASKEF